MQEEFKSLKDKDTQESVPFPSKRKLVQCKWVYRTKVAFDGSDIKYQFRFVSKGFSQVQGVDYIDTFALVSKVDSISVVLVVVASKRWEVHHMDVKSDFIHGEIHEDIYMQHHECFIHDPSLVCRLKKYLYGLKQAPRAWYAKINNFLLSQGFERWKLIPMCICNFQMTEFRSQYYMLTIF